MRTTRWLVATMLVAAVPLVVQFVPAQEQPASKPASAGSLPPTGRFEFEVIESFDAKYLGDTPGHIGKSGGLGSSRPNVALGDPVYRGDIKVGTVTNLVWDRGRGSLQIEFDPEPRTRILVGDPVWIQLDTTTTPAGSSPAK